MKIFVCCFVVLTIICLCDPTKAASLTRIRRQWEWGGQGEPTQSVQGRPTRPPRPTRPTRPSRPTRPTPTASPLPVDDGTTTTSSPQYVNCVGRCQVTPQYNPVCGSNRITYENEGRLRCAQRCGLNVEVAVGGACSSS